MDWFSTLSLALGSAWTSGINLYATVTVLGLLQKFGATKLPGGLDALDQGSTAVRCGELIVDMEAAYVCLDCHLSQYRRFTSSSLYF